MKLSQFLQALVGTAAFGLIGQAAAGPITFDLADSSKSSVAISGLESICLWSECGVSVRLNPSLGSLSATLEAGESWSFDFFSINFWGVGAGTATLSAALGFDSPYATRTAAGSAIGHYLSGGFLFSAGVLSWTVQPGYFTLADGTRYSVAFQDLIGMTAGSQINVRARVTLDRVAVRVQEPRAIALLGVGLLALGFALRRRRTTVRR